MNSLNKNFTRRSFIFTPPLKSKMFDKAINSGADIVCLELEDGISPKEKKPARKMALDLIKKKKLDNKVEILIRINCIREAFGISDIKDILDSKAQPNGIMIPKVKNPEEIVILDNLFTERSLNTKFHIIIETNQGLQNAYQIASSSNRIEALFFGAVDMSAELRCRNDWEALLYARSRVVHAAASNELDVIDVPFLDLEDLKGMENEAHKAKKIGFTGKGSVHPKQIEILNKVFTPTIEEYNNAKNLINTFDKTTSGLLVYKGKLIEKPVLREMYKIIKTYEKVNTKNS